VTAAGAWREPRWRVAAFLAAAAALNYADRAAISSVLPSLRAEFLLDDTQLGLLGSIFLWTYALASPLAGLLADSAPRPVLIAGSLALWSGLTVLIGCANGLVVFLLLRGALGAAESLFLPSATALLADHHAPRTRGRAMSVLSVGLNFGVVLGGTFTGYLAEHLGWRSGFWVLGGTGIALALAARPCLAGPASVTPRPPAARVPLAEAERYLLGVRSYHVLLAKAMLAGVGIWIFLNWLPLYFREEFGFTLGAAGFAGTFMLQGATVLGIALGGWLSDRAAVRGMERRMLAQGLCYLASAPFLLLFLAHPDFTLVVVAVAAFSLFRGLGQANENPILCEVLPARFRSTGIGLMNTGSTAAGGLGVLVAGVLKPAYGLGLVFAGISLLFVLAGLALLVAARWWMPADIARARADDARAPAPA